MAHAAHTPVPAAAPYVPATQGAHGVAPPGEYCPDGHTVHALAPVAAVYCPAGHALQIVRPVVAAMVPARQALHDPAPLVPTNVPRAHGVHDDADAPL